MTRRWIALPVLVCGVVAGTAGSYAAWSARPSPDAPAAEEEEEDGLNPQALRGHLRTAARAQEAARDWLAAEVAYAARLRDLPRLVALSTGEDVPFRENEEAALLTCRGLLLEGRTYGYERVREAWRGRERHAGAWLALDADVLLQAGRPDEARALLSARRLPGAEDAGRLARLALAAPDAASARQFLDRAAALAPGDPDVRGCRGRLLEAEGRPAEAAAEFTAALAVRGDDWEVRDRLAECYRRAGAPEAALATWMAAGETPRPDSAWLKAWFWNRVTRPAAYDWEATAPAAGPLQPLAAFLVSLPPEAFWADDSERGHVPHGLIPQRQEVYWLRVLAFLQAGRESDAAYTMRAGPFRNVSWQPDLEDALDRVLTFRAGQPQRPPAEGPPAGRHPFFVRLEQLAASGDLAPGTPGMPADLARLLGGTEAVPAALLAAGWDEAALLLHRRDADLSGLPGWYVEGLARALRDNRGVLPALAFVEQQPRTPALDLLAGELLLKEGRGAEALDRLRSAAGADDARPEATRALAEAALRLGHPAEARRALEARPRLLVGVEGRTLLARCAAVEGNADLAERLYRDLADESAEARAYLVHRAVAGGDWAAASRLVGELTRQAGR
jgi:tetratricopeptide (TPR) repeat protein